VQLFTTSEAATYLRLKERKLYELVAENSIPCTKVTGRWLFSKDDLDRWLDGSMQRPAGFAERDPMPIVGGSHDPLLEWSLRESHSGLASLPEGSEAGFERFLRGEIVAAALHLHRADEIDANVDAMKSRPNLHDAVLIAFSSREQGLIVAHGNPLKIKSIEDVVARRARMAVRPPGAGAQLLLTALLHRARLDADKLSTVDPPSPTGADVAHAIRTGRADCGIASRSIVNASGLHFIPLVWERFDIVMRQRDFFRAPLQSLVGFLKSPALAARAQELGGYDVSRAGEIRHAP
jgi:excisionase family DNA binding protein